MTKCGGVLDTDITQVHIFLSLKQACTKLGCELYKIELADEFIGFSACSHCYSGLLLLPELGGTDSFFFTEEGRELSGVFEAQLIGYFGDVHLCSA